jgi:hypothetical protein
MGAVEGSTRAIAIIGAGPRGTSLLERLTANAADLLGDETLVIHLLDPFPAGPGRVWRRDQPGLLWMNSTAADNTMFPDASVMTDGPTDTGPDFVTWATGIGRERLAGTEVGVEAARVHPGWFPSRHLYGEYLTWMVDRAAADAPSSVSVQHHRELAVDLTEEGGRQVLHLGGGGQLVVDVVLLAQGHQDVEPTEEERGLAAFAADHGMVYVPSAYSADPSLDDLPAGADVLVRGPGWPSSTAWSCSPRVAAAATSRRRGPSCATSPPGASPACSSGPAEGCRTTPRPPTPCSVPAPRSPASSAPTPPRPSTACGVPWSCAPTCGRCSARSSRSAGTTSCGTATRTG